MTVPGPPSLRAVAPQTKTDAAVEALRDAVLRGDIRPGEPIRAAATARVLGMSATPVREALRVLQAQGLITQEPHRPGTVATLDPAEVEELYMLRGLLEGKATELAAGRAAEADLAALEDIHAELERRAEAPEGDAFTGVNADWHFAIYTLSGATSLREFIVRLWVRVPWNQIYVVPGRCAASVTEHRAILDAMAAGDAELAGRLMTEHVGSGLATLTALLEHRADRAGPPTTARSRWSGPG